MIFEDYGYSMSLVTSQCIESVILKVFKLKKLTSSILGLKL